MDLLGFPLFLHPLAVSTMFRAWIVVFLMAALTLADPIQPQTDQTVTFETIQPFEMPNSLSEDPIPLSTVKPQAETTTTVNDEHETVQEVHTPKPLFELNPEVDQWIKEEEEAVLSAVENPTETGKAFASKTMNGLKMLTNGLETVATKAFYGLKTVASGALNGLQSIASTTMDILGNYLNK